MAGFLQLDYIYKKIKIYNLTRLYWHPCSFVWVCEFNEVKSLPGALVISAYAVCPDITATVTPDLEDPDGKGKICWKDKSITFIGWKQNCLWLFDQKIPTFDHKTHISHLHTVGVVFVFFPLQGCCCGFLLAQAATVLAALLWLSAIASWGTVLPTWTSLGSWAPALTPPRSS